MSKKNWFLLISFLTLIFTMRLVTMSQPHFVSGTKVRITATLTEEPKIIGQTQTFTLLGLKIKTWRYPEFHYGQKLQVLGTIKKGNEMEAAEEIKIVGEDKGFRGEILAFRRKIEAIYRQVLPEPQSSLLAGIVLGSKSGLPSTFFENLRRSGTLHVVVASGMNVTIVASTLISFFLLFLSRRPALILAFLGIWFYVFLAGGEIPVIRAGIMGTLVFLAQGLGREDDAWRGLGLAAVILLLLDSLSLFDLGFQLSFCATAGILYFGPKISGLLWRLPKQIRPDIAQTLGAQIATMPLLLINFGQYSAFSFPANILVVTILSLIMKLGAIVAILGLIFAPLGQIFAWFLWPLLTYFVKVVELFSKL